MAIIGTSGKVTLLDIAQSLDPNGRIAKVAELLTKRNEILLDMPMMEGNLPTGHQGTVRTGLPSVVWRSFYQGVPPSKSQRAKVTDACGKMEGRSEVDADEARLSGDPAGFRLSEATAFVEALNQQAATAVFYGNMGVNPEQFNGLAPRFSSLSAQNAQNIIDAGGVGSDNASMWLVVWSPETITGIYPKGSQAGLIHQDLGEIDAFDANNNRFRALSDLWKWNLGLHVKDWRFAVRIANIDVSDLVNQTGTQANTATTVLHKLMIRALSRIPFQGAGTAAFYANRTLKEMLSIQALDKSQNVLRVEEAVRQFGDVSISTPELRFLGVPIRTVDALLTTEARVV